MWPFSTNRPTQRRLEVRKNIPPAKPRLSSLKQAGGWRPVLLASLLAASAIAIDVHPTKTRLFRPGQYMSDDVRSRVELIIPADVEAATAWMIVATAPTGVSTKPAAGAEPPSVEYVTEPVATPRALVYKPGDILVPASWQYEGGEWKLVTLTQGQAQLLSREELGYQQWLRVHRPLAYWSKWGARAAIFVLLSAMLFVYLGTYRADVLRRVGPPLALVMVIIALLAANKLIFAMLGWNVHMVMLPATIAAMVLAIAYEQRLALAVGALAALMMVLHVHGDLGLLMAVLTAVVVSALLLKEIRTQGKLLKVAAITAGMASVVVLAKDLVSGLPWQTALYDVIWSAVAIVVIPPLLVQASLPLIERLFGVATAMTLLAWCDASKPLLRRLAMEAPGTFNHSLQLGAMSEAAAEAIGASGLLARVGAYYHDVGKINKPDYFVENQLGLPSRHEKLSPAMSLLIILGHVKDGIELAKEYNLPIPLRELIATHHGTTLVQYFYHAAAAQRKADSERAPDEVEFRYPGPKPHMKEAAILMLADAAESSVRSMSEPTPGHIETQVHSVVTQRLMDGQLDNCEITLKDVHSVESSLVKSLCSVYHSRIAYPKAPKPGKPAPAPDQQPQPAEPGRNNGA